MMTKNPKEFEELKGMASRAVFGWSICRGVDIGDQFFHSLWNSIILKKCAIRILARCGLETGWKAGSTTGLGCLI